MFGDVVGLTVAHPRLYDFGLHTMGCEATDELVTGLSHVVVAALIGDDQ
jgi:hypothetical protein